MFTLLAVAISLGLLAFYFLPLPPRRVEFQSHGVKLVGHLFFPAPYWNNGAAIVVVGPQTSVKEQVSTEYAKRLRALGFIALAYDPRTYGESDGEPREFENPQWKVEDIKSAVKFMGTLQEVENSRVGV